MPRFHFNVYDGVSLPDRSGVELPDRRTAQVEATRLAGELLGDAAARRRLGRDWRMEVTDAAGAVILRLDLTGVAASEAGDGV